MPPRFELFDHTADIGVRATAPTLPQLVEPATEGLYAAIGELTPKPGGRARTFEFRGDDPALLLRDYLAELLHVFDVENHRTTRVEVREFSPTRLHVLGDLNEVDPRRSTLLREVKAVTYHQLAIYETPGGYEAVFILDI